MAENLLIRLGSNAEESISWMIWSQSEQHIIASGELANADELTQLTEKALSRKVTVVVPGCDVVLKKVEVPAKSQKAIRQAVPYMLEDELAQDVEELFFAYQDKNSATENNCHVAVVERAQILLWLSWLSNADISTTHMLPDVLLMPPASENWQAISLEHQILIRQGDWQGLLLDEAHWPLISQSWEDKSSIHIDAFSTLPETNADITIHSQPEELPLALFAQQLGQQSFTLLQGDLKPKRAQSPHSKTWGWVAGFALAALIVNLVFKSVTLVQINNEQAAVESQIIETYKKTFPKTKKVRVSTIRSQLKRKMADVGSSASQESFLTLLNKVVPAFSKVPQLKPDSLKFDSKRNELRLQATAASYQQFEQFKTLLENQQLSVSQGAQNNQGNRISGSFSITLNKGGK